MIHPKKMKHSFIVGLAQKTQFVLLSNKKFCMTLNMFLVSIQRKKIMKEYIYQVSNLQSGGFDGKKLRAKKCQKAPYFQKKLILIIKMFMPVSKWSKKFRNNLYRHIQKNKMTYKPITHFNNGFFLYLKNSFLNKIARFY